MQPPPTSPDIPDSDPQPQPESQQEAQQEAQPKRRDSPGEQTRRRILEATLATLKTRGISGTSARNIAKAGDFNQALIFYHFDSVSGAVTAAIGEMSRQRLERHATRLEEATSLVDLIDTALELHREDAESNAMTALIQAFAGAAGDATTGPALYSELAQWNDMVAVAIERVLGDSPLLDLAPRNHMARTIGALFLGIELLDDLDPEAARSEDLFATLRSLAAMLQMLIDSPAAALLPALMESSESAPQ